MESKRILITGAAGSIGSELTRQLAKTNQVLGLDFNETDLFDLYEELKLADMPIKTRTGDIRNQGTVDDVFHNFQPQVVLHAAAYKHVSPMELDPIEAVENNIIGTFNLVQASKKYGVEKFINISTDKVVGETIMGLTKKIAEQIVHNAGYISVRFGNVLGSRGSVIPIWQKQLDLGLPLTITDPNMTRFFMTIPEACRLVIKAAEEGVAGDKIILDMGPPRNILEVAKEILNKLNKPEYPIKMIGARPGEALSERLMTNEEENRAEKKEGYYIIKG